MRYLVLLFGDEATGSEPGDPAWDEEMAGYEAFAERAGAAILGGEALESVTTTRTVRHDGAEVTVTAGPFAETTECLGGYYVLEAATIDDVVELVRHLPPAMSGGIEVRPLVQWVDAGASPSDDGTARFLVTIHGDETDAETPGSAAWDAGAAEHARFGGTAGDALLAAGAVQPTSTAKVVQVRDDELLVTDGAYPDVTALVGGLYLLRATPDAVAELAAAIPTPEGDAVEIRPILEMG